jgi:hypothetical protein
LALNSKPTTFYSIPIFQPRPSRIQNETFFFNFQAYGSGPEMLALGQRPNGTSTPLFIMNSAGEEDEEQVDYGEDSGGENGMSFNGQARSTT